MALIGALVLASACGANLRPVSSRLSSRPFCVGLVRQGVLIAPVTALGAPTQTPSGETMRTWVRTGVDTTAMVDTVLLSLTDSVVVVNDHAMRQANARFRDMDSRWVERNAHWGWETKEDSLILLQSTYGVASRSAIPLVPIGNAGVFLSETHMGTREEGDAWMIPRSCADSTP
jgi:hypothetical protein